MDELKQIYEEIIKESRFKKDYGGINVREFADFEIDKISRAIMRRYECTERGVDPETDSTYISILNEKPPHTERPKRLTREEKYVFLAKKIKDINIDNGEILSCKLSNYNSTYEYRDLTFEEFCSYIFWRTQIRNKKEIIAPKPYLWLYLVELCNFVEFDTVEETYDMLLFLFSIQKAYQMKDVVREALSAFSICYGTIEIAQKHLERNYNFENAKNSVLLLNGKHLNSFCFLISKSSYKLNESETFLECPQTVEKCFMYFFDTIVDKLKLEGIDLLSLWLGKYTLERPYKYFVKVINSDFVIEKEIIEEGLLLKKVDREGVQEAIMECIGQDVDPGARIFNRSYIITYLFRLFDNELRKLMGKEQIVVSTKSICKMMEHQEHPVLGNIITFYESEIIINCAKSAINMYKSEFEFERQKSAINPQSDFEFIYCSVEIEGRKRSYYYIAEYDNIVEGDTVIVPFGFYDSEEKGIVKSIKRCNESNAPFPPSKTKRIIRKYYR